MLTSPFRLTPTYEPTKPMVSASTTNIGSINVAATTLVTTRYLNGLVPDTCIASICSVTFIEASSAPTPDPTFPAKINAVTAGPISRKSETATIAGSHDAAPNFARVGLDWIVRTRPIMKPVIPTRGSDRLFQQFIKLVWRLKHFFEEVPRKSRKRSYLHEELRDKRIGNDLRVLFRDDLCTVELTFGQLYVSIVHCRYVITYSTFAILMPMCTCAFKRSAL
jgi:hypothetical protein